MPYSKELFMIKLNGPDNGFLANFIRFVGKLLGPQARDGTSALMISLILECLDGWYILRRYILHDIGSGRKSIYDFFELSRREISTKCFFYGLRIVNDIVT